MTNNPTQADLDALAPLVESAHSRNAAIVAGAAEKHPAIFDASEEATSTWAIESLARSAENWRKRYVAERELFNDLNAALLKLEKQARIRHAAWCAIGLVVGIAAALWWRW